MADYHLAETEAKFAELIWASEPIPSRELVKLSEKELGWKSTTTYTVLRRLCDRGLFRNEQSVVTSLVSRAEFQAKRSRRFVEDTFGGSLPGFLAAFMGGERLTRAQADEIRRLIEEYEEGEP
ncbi:MAG: BlaI/MecI/CopY family transcriptional regulator [Oscillospiraceae bacterium]|nr:BlaI/MecI/CopY family transcriptional regulator [Oscillospiraceae bacterium]